MKPERKKLRKKKCPCVTQHHRHREIILRQVKLLSLKTILKQVTTEIRKSRFSSVQRLYTEFRMLDTVILTNHPQKLILHLYSVA